MQAYATGKQDGEKSWVEIASEAAGVAKSVFDKVKSGASAALQAVTKPKDAAAPSDRRQEQWGRAPLQQQQQQQQSPLAPLFGDGLLGRAVGGLVASAVKGLGEQMERQAREAQGLYEDAAAAIRASPEVAARMGGAVTVGPAISQSSSSSSVNGRVTKRVSLILPVTGPGRSMAQAQVVSSEGPGTVSTTDIVVVLPGGDSIRVAGGRGGGGRPGAYQQGGVVIDAEFQDISGRP
ncbi:hypothetical protein MNEG_3161 [Monoraphidium neglectum]|uniref:Uncharacterized protein n=1 Tax=Monoraphidium neglectum TaxID=145388 RepID=A0A0D2LDL0_9CHLO|nr:hypothetical protein MNEG_3161 [Monoraphidium neglectum]KIZ04794.1 hypothetical protein MNEG_3161 [Monoraphidium neglectum]|eukprot:XP_013903813.1 hypothetical protein MNEG_3161 [Monoraphidium neglectum]